MSKLADQDKQIIEDFISNKANFREIIQIDKKGLNEKINLEVTLPFTVYQYLKKPWITLIIFDGSDNLEKYFQVNPPKEEINFHEIINQSFRTSHSRIIREGLDNESSQKIKGLLSTSVGKNMKFYFNQLALDIDDATSLIVHAISHPEQYVTSNLIDDINNLLNSFDGKKV